MNSDKLRESFRNPGAEHRSAPFWAWNDKLEKAEIVRQIEGMKEQGVGGFFMHSRDGLETRYMGEEWMDHVKQAVQTAADNGMIAWIYDEDRWPSGSAGGIVPAQGDAYRAKGLTIELTREALEVEASHVALFRAEIDGMEIYRSERLACRPGLRYPKPNDNEVLLVCRVEVAEACEWFNDESPHDNLNPDSVRLFIDTTYEAYKEAIGEQFGKTVAGVFTDEPSVADRHCRFTEGRGWLPWTYSFPAYYLDKRGSDVFDTLPYVFFNGALSSAARHDYWRTVSDMFSESYSGQLGQWCEDNGLLFTGHYLWENKLGVATRVCGAIMPNYRYQHVPGIDILMEQVDETITVKQCTSVANQYGRKQVITETYGCAGWEFTFEGQKWVGDFQYVMGVNLRSQHLALYSIKGCRKRDYPPVFNYNTTWWNRNRVVEDYFARVGSVMQPGMAVRDVLVVHPASTAWARLGANPYGIPDRNKDRDIPGINQYGDEFNRFLRGLLGAHYDFDLGDETIMAEAGRVAPGQLYVNLAGYRVVVIPAMQTMLRSTYRLLLDYLEAGGQVIAVQPVPCQIEGREDSSCEELFAHPNLRRVPNAEAVVGALESCLPRRISLTGDYMTEAPEMLYLLKELEDCRTLFVVNNDRGKSLNVRLTADFEGRIEEWNPLTGEVAEVEAEYIDGKLVVDTAYPPAGSRLYVIFKEGQSAPKQPILDDGEMALNPFAVKLHASLGPLSSFTRTMPNALVLDKCAYRLGGPDGAWSEELEVWQAQREVRDRLGMRQVYYNGLPQRYKWADHPHPGDGAKLELRFRFQVHVLPDQEVYLALEEADRIEVELNGLRSESAPEGWFMDRAIRRVRLEGLRLGDNELLLSCDYLNRMELEDCYLIGDFGVSPERAIIAEPSKLRFGDWGLQGYFHYAGSMIYHFEFDCRLEEGERAILHMGEYSAVTLDVSVNGQEAGSIPWRAANGLDVTAFLKNGSNRIDIEAAGSPRNLFGPFHQARGAVPSTGWESFRVEGGEYTPEYLVHPYGILQTIHIRKI
ncbi:glycosyl hydrolase [Cohnella boryungensis]|uniref:Glycosyl hydrolase n=1 Tax=Cohnella boryungensis TaxID=768479 RepID=A0ABV8S708_9BACL